MIVDEETTPDMRASAQGIFNIVAFGVAVLVGNYFAAQVAEAAAGNYKILFGTPLAICIGCLVILLVFYPNKPAVPAQAT
jgi:predicted MFS family arabinose efflux permease